MYPFRYHRPRTLAEALALRAAEPESRYLAGGQTLIPTMKQRLAAPAALIDLGALAELAGMRSEPGRLVIGALTRHAEVAADLRVRAEIPVLAALAGDIGDPAIRSLGTLGGAIANADPAADYPAALLALDAAIVTDRRTIAADDFFTGLFETALAEDELVLAVGFRRPDRAAWAKFPNPASGYAMVGVLVACFGAEVRLAVTGAGPAAFRLPAFEAALAQDFDPAALAGRSVAPDGLNSDLHAGADYRAHLIMVIARRAVAAAAAPAPEPGR